MHESFLHYIWQFQYFNKENLLSIEGEEVSIQHPGQVNTHAGPDFSQAKIKIGAIDWVGTVEIHTQASMWNQHRHGRDSAYDNVVLHVVWQNDQQVFRSDGTALPTLELKGRVDEKLVHQYRKLVDSGFPIPCTHSFSHVADVVKLSMLDRAVIHRLERKAAEVESLLQHNQGDWEETAYQVIARNFGFKVNSEPFLQLARHLPYKIIRKHLSFPLQVEALLFGQAGMLEKEAIKDSYYLDLKREYKFLAAKYALEPVRLKVSQWRFLRLRPANFPTLRIAQLASLLLAQPHLFSLIKDTREVVALKELFAVGQGAYWKDHYRFGMKAKNFVSEVGESSRENILINSVAPLLVAYGRQYDDTTFTDRAMELLQSLPAEKNKILSAWSALGWNVRNAFDTQGLIELYNSFCTPRQCLQCGIGVSILKPQS